MPLRTYYSVNMPHAIFSILANCVISKFAYVKKLITFDLSYFKPCL